MKLSSHRPLLAPGLGPPREAAPSKPLTAKPPATRHGTTPSNVYDGGNIESPTEEIPGKQQHQFMSLQIIHTVVMETVETRRARAHCVQHESRFAAVLASPALAGQKLGMSFCRPAGHPTKNTADGLASQQGSILITKIDYIEPPGRSTKPYRIHVTPLKIQGQLGWPLFGAATPRDGAGGCGQRLLSSRYGINK